MRLRRLQPAGSRLKPLVGKWVTMACDWGRGTPMMPVEDQRVRHSVFEISKKTGMRG
jgi:hypothetical protein